MAFNGALTLRKEHKKTIPPVISWDIFLPDLSHSFGNIKLLDVLSVFIQINKVNCNKVMFSTFWDIFITFHFFWRRGRLTTGKEPPHFVPNLYSNFSVKSVLKAKTCASKTFRTELWVNSESHGNHKIKMASICCESGSLMKALLRRLGISTSELKISQNEWS